MLSFTITAWYISKGKPYWLKYAVDANSLSDAFRRVFDHMARGFRSEAGDWVNPDRILISDWTN